MKGMTAKEIGTINRVGKVRMIKNSIKVYNGLCQRCRMKIARNPKTNIEDYCDQCKAMAKEVWNDYVD